MKHIIPVLLIALLAACSPKKETAESPEKPFARSVWNKEQANQWYQDKPWYAGANFNPSTAINQLETWQADSFNPEVIDRELAWAEGIGMNLMRVYLHHLAWEQDPEGDCCNRSEHNKGESTRIVRCAQGR